MAEGRSAPSYAVFGAVIVAALAVGYWLSGGGGESPADLETQLRVGELRDKEKERSEKVALARVAQQRAVDTGTRALELLEVSLKEQGRWQTGVEPLLSSQEGRVLASDDVLVEGFVQVYDEKRPSRAELESARPRIEALLNEPKAALADPSSAYQPTDALVTELERERAALEKAAATYKTSRERVESLLAGAKQKGIAPGGISLEQAISERRTRDVLALAEAETQRKERHQREEQQKQAALDESLHQQRLQAMDAQAEQDRLALEQRAKTDQQLRERQAERERLVAMANDPATQALFAPFLSKGKVRPGKNYPFEPPAPMSFSELQGINATANAKNFIRIATDAGDDRPRWKKPQTEEDWATAEANLELFNQLAPIWVEQGKLTR